MLRPFPWRCMSIILFAEESAEHATFERALYSTFNVLLGSPRLSTDTREERRGMGLCEGALWA